jgi:exopolysaccharide biosynthesis polyprenyl glycosylphosphotransferase
LSKDDEVVRQRKATSMWIVLSDIVLIAASIVIAYWMRYELQWFRDISYYHPLSAYLPFCVLFTALMLLFFQADRVYYHWQKRSWIDQLYGIINATAKAVVVILSVTFVLQPLEYSRLLLIEAGVNAVVLLGTSRWLAQSALAWLRERGRNTAKVVIVGAGESGRTVMRTIVARPELGYECLGFVDDNPEKGQVDIGRFRALGPIDNLARIIQDEAVDEVIITLPWMYHRKIMGIVRECEQRHVSAQIVPDLFQMSLSQVSVDDIGGIPLIGVRDVRFEGASLFAKRTLDIVGAAVILVAIAPLLAVIAAAIRIDSAGPVIFRQTRVGRHGRLFEMLKFRSMRVGAEEELRDLQALNEADGPLFKIRDDPRLTSVGRLLRHTSLDELPQLWNVLRAEMSLVGPRPPIPSEVATYEQWHRKRLDGRPGMTGLWQISGRSMIPFEEMVLLDIYYIENWSIWLDFKILVRTIPKVLYGAGAY